MKSGIILLLIVSGFICADLVSGQQLVTYTSDSDSDLFGDRVCLDNGGACRSHGECCSNRCSRLSSECVISYRPSLTFASKSSPGNGILLNRFGENQWLEGNYDLEIENSLHEPIVENDLTVSSEQDGTITCKGKLFHCVKDSECCSKVCKFNVCVTSGEVTSPPTCSKIGEMCTQDKECCTGRCPHFWGKCVT